jgi:predicted tellurium resistance membrane protein TerC
MLILGLAISILLMGVAATLISRLLERFPVIAYIGVALIVWIGLKMVYEDATHLYARFVTGEPDHPTVGAPLVPGGGSGASPPAGGRPAGAN